MVDAERAARQHRDRLVDGAGRPVPAAGPAVRAWTASWVYTGGQTVAHNGHTWKAQWWTRNQAPGNPTGPWQDLGAY